MDDHFDDIIDTTKLDEADAMTATAAIRKDPPPWSVRPDGWHLYHICQGKPQELAYTVGGALCVLCGQWGDIRVTPSGRKP